MAKDGSGQGGATGAGASGSMDLSPTAPARARTAAAAAAAAAAVAPACKRSTKACASIQPKPVIARLVGDGIDYKIRRGTMSVLLGRQNKTVSVDVVLPSTKEISREHVRISYNYYKYAGPDRERRFYLEVLGRNGVKVNGVQYEKGGDPVRLQSGALLEIGADVSFHFYIDDDATLAAKAVREEEKKAKEGAAASKPAATPPAARNKDQSSAAADTKPKKEDSRYAAFEAALNNVVGGSKDGAAAAAAAPAPERKREREDGAAGGSKRGRVPIPSSIFRRIPVMAARKSLPTSQPRRVVFNAESSGGGEEEKKEDEEEDEPVEQCYRTPECVKPAGHPGFCRIVKAAAAAAEGYAPAAAPAAIQLGCSKCRYNRIKGCKTCRTRAGYGCSRCRYRPKGCDKCRGLAGVPDRRTSAPVIDLTVEEDADPAAPAAEAQASDRVDGGGSVAAVDANPAAAPVEGLNEEEVDPAAGVDDTAPIPSSFPINTASGAGLVAEKERTGGSGSGGAAAEAATEARAERDEGEEDAAPVVKRRKVEDGSASGGDGGESAPAHTDPNRARFPRKLELSNIFDKKPREQPATATSEADNESLAAGDGVAPKDAEPTAPVIDLPQDDVQTASAPAPIASNADAAAAAGAAGAALPAPMEVDAAPAPPPLAPAAPQPPAPAGWSPTALADYNQRAPQELVPYTTVVLALHGLLSGGRVGHRRAWEAVTAPLLRQRWPEGHTAGLERLAEAIVAAVAPRNTPASSAPQLQQERQNNAPNAVAKPGKRSRSPGGRFMVSGDRASHPAAAAAPAPARPSNKRKSAHPMSTMDTLSPTTAEIEAAEGVSGAGVVVGPKGRRSQRARPPAGYHAHLESAGIIDEGYGRSRKRARSPGGRFVSKRQRGGGSSTSEEEEEMEEPGYGNNRGGGGQPRRRRRPLGSTAAAADRPLSWHPAAAAAPPASMQPHRLDEEWALLRTHRTNVRENTEILMRIVDLPAVAAGLGTYSATVRGQLLHVLQELGKPLGPVSASPQTFHPPAPPPQFSFAPPQPQSPPLPFNLAPPPQQQRYPPPVPQHLQHSLVHPAPPPPAPVAPSFFPSAAPPRPTALHLGSVPPRPLAPRRPATAQATSSVADVLAAVLASIRPPPAVQRPAPAPAPARPAQPLSEALATALAAVATGGNEGVAVAGLADQIISAIQGTGGDRSQQLPVPPELRDASGGLSHAKVQAALKNLISGGAGALAAVAAPAAAGLGSTAPAPAPAVVPKAPVAPRPENTGAKESLASQMNGLLAAAQMQRSSGLAAAAVGGAEPVVALNPNPANVRLQETLARLQEHAEGQGAGQAINVAAVTAAVAVVPAATAPVAPAEADPVAPAPGDRSPVRNASLPGSTAQQEQVVAVVEDVAAAAPAPTAAADGLPPAPKPSDPANPEGHAPSLTQQNEGIASLLPAPQPPAPAEPPAASNGNADTAAEPSAPSAALQSAEEGDAAGAFPDVDAGAGVGTM